jgi:hypothetical protein
VKKFLTIFFLFVFAHAFAQTDASYYTDTATAETTTAKPIVKPVIKKPVVKKDSAATVAIPQPVQNNNLLRDSLQKDSLQKAAQAVVINPVEPGIKWPDDTAFAKLLSLNINKKIKPTLFEGEPRHDTANDILFYMLLGVVFLLAFIKVAFPKYFINLFRMFMQTSFRQKQTREQLLQDRLPSLLMNLFFIVVTGVFVAIAIEQEQVTHMNIWVLIIYCIAVLALIYFGKFLVILFTGWVFNTPEAASTYSFIIFLINKIIGVAVVPLLFLLVYSSAEVQKIIITAALCIITVLLVYRYILSYSIIRRNLSINALHFFIYLCGVEILPMIIIYKAIFNIVGTSN